MHVKVVDVLFAHLVYGMMQCVIFNKCFKWEYIIFILILKEQIKAPNFAFLGFFILFRLNDKKFFFTKYENITYFLFQKI